MKSKIATLTPDELRVYAEIAFASVNGVCNEAATVLRHRCDLKSTHVFYKHLATLEEKGLIKQTKQCYGVPRIIELTTKGMPTSKYFSEPLTEALICLNRSRLSVTSFILSSRSVE
jgi:hypothetical protein